MKIQEELYNFIQTLLPTSIQFLETDNLQETGILDSVSMMELVLWSEGHFNFVIDTDDLVPENFSTLKTITDYVNRCIEKA